MWYLIIPPIIVVLSLSFVLWYLSRKGADPLIAEKAFRLGEEAQDQISFLRTKNFFLRILEKTAYRFKVVSLRMHNKLNDLTQALKARRRRFQDGVLAKKSLEQTKALEREQISHQVSSSEVVLGEPIFRRTKSTENFEKSQLAPVSHESAFPRPMVSETVARPEIAREKISADSSREESLIAQIAVNPKDFVAYEGLGDYYLEIGNVKDAKECYRQVLKLSPLHRIVRIKIRRLEKLLEQ